MGPAAHRTPAAATVEPLLREVLGRRLRILRQERAEPLARTARRAGVSPQYLSEVERGIKEPSSEMVAAIAGALGTGLLDLTVGIARDLHDREAGRATTSSTGAEPTAVRVLAVAA